MAAEAETCHSAVTDVMTAPDSNGWTTTTVGEWQTFTKLPHGQKKVTNLWPSLILRHLPSVSPWSQMWSRWWIPDMTSRRGGPPVSAGAPRTRPPLWGLSRAAGRCLHAPLISNFRSSSSAPVASVKPASWRDLPTTLSVKLASRP